MSGVKTKITHFETLELHPCGTEVVLHFIRVKMYSPHV